MDGSGEGWIEAIIAGAFAGAELRPLYAGLDPGLLRAIDSWFRFGSGAKEDGVKRGR